MHFLKKYLVLFYTFLCEEQSKLDTKSKNCIFLSLENGVKGHKLFRFKQKHLLVEM